MEEKDRTRTRSKKGSRTNQKKKEEEERRRRTERKKKGGGRAGGEQVKTNEGLVSYLIFYA